MCNVIIDRMFVDGMIMNLDWLMWFWIWQQDTPGDVYFKTHASTLFTTHFVCLEICASNHSIGLTDGSFGERGLIATTFLDAQHTPNWARLHQPRSWSPAILNDLSIEQYVQITFFRGQFLLKNIAMQGNPLSDWWVTKFRISTSNDGENFVKTPTVIKIFWNRVFSQELHMFTYPCSRAAKTVDFKIWIIFQKKLVGDRTRI